MAVVQQPPAASDYFQNQFPSTSPSPPIIWKKGWEVGNAPATTKRQLSMVGPTSPAQSIASGTSSPRRLLHTLSESDEENTDTGSELDQPLYSAAVESFLTLKEPTPEDFKPCESAKSEIRPSKPRAISFEEAKADMDQIWPFAQVKAVRVKKASLTSVDRDKWPLASINPVIPIPEEERLLELDVQTLAPDKSPEDRLQEAEKLLVQFQNAYKTRSMSVHQLEKQVDDQASQLKESELWNDSVARRMMSLTARISEQESAILQLGQELGKEREKRREEEEEAFQHKLDGLNRVYPPVSEDTHRRMSSIPGLSRSGSFNNYDGSRRESNSHAAPRYMRHSSSASFSTSSGGHGSQRRPSIFARMFRQGSAGSSSSGSESPPHSHQSSFSSRVSGYMTSQSKIAVAADKDIETAVDRLKTLEEVRTEVGILRQKLESLELELSALNDFPPAGSADVSLSP